MLINVELDDKALAVFEQMLQDRLDRGLSPAPVFHAIAEDFARIERQAFATQGASIGARWAPLAPWWLQFRIRHGLGSSILRFDSARGGRLFRALTATVPGAPWSILRFGTDSVTVGTSLGIAPTHQKGATVTIPGRPSRTVRIPRRRFVQLRQHDKARWLSYEQEWISSGHVGRGMRRF